MISVHGLTKSYGTVHALAGIDLEVPEGQVFSLLGPNGAGKTTLVRVLSTLIKPDGGVATVNGHDVVRDSKKVRGSISLTGQYAAVDELLTGAENLRMMARLWRLSGPRERANKLLAQFDLQDAANRLVRTYSGGMRRRLDLAISLLASPRVVFLDEPTTGLDPRSRASVWEMVSTLAAGGVTVFLTTQYLEEADKLADRFLVIDHGRIVADGTPAELKSQVPGGHLALTFDDPAELERAARAVTGTIDELTLSVPTNGSFDDVKQIINRLGDARPETMTLSKPTLDDVFLHLTGGRA
jgi:ABC-2 type transport system ATP-binding protein